MPNLSGEVKTGRIYLRLPEETIEEMNRLAKESGMVPSYFLANALVVGARVMARQLNPERYIPEAVLDVYREHAKEMARASAPAVASGVTDVVGRMLESQAFRDSIKENGMNEVEFLRRFAEEVAKPN